MQDEQQENQQVIEGKIFALLSYLSILCIIPLVLKKDNDFVLAHGKQGLVIFVAEVAVFIASIVISWIAKPLYFILLIFSLIGIISALKGEFIKLPVISEIAEKIIL